MGRIQSTVGLISGVNIANTVDQLMQLAARPRDLLVSRSAELQQKQVALGELTALLIAVQLSSDNLGKADLFSQRTVTSSNESLLAAQVTGHPAAGTYSYTPVRTAQSHQLLSSGFASLDAPLSAGQLLIPFGGVVDRAVELDQLNGGAGIERGKIRITDRSGNSAVVDLRYVQTIDDVVAAINATDSINVTAVADGDALRLIDNTGQTTSNLQVQEVGAGATAASLGMAGIDVASSEVTGQDILSLHEGMALSALNDGSGVELRTGIAELEITFRDNSSPLQIELDGAQRLGDVIAAINQADPTRLQARISSDGDRLELVDLTADSGGTFSVQNVVGGTAADDLGLTTTAAGDLISSHHLQGGLRGPLLSSLNGGAGFSLGQLSLTDRSGATATVDLSAAQTLEDVLQAINSAGVGIRASINTARNGIQLQDTTGLTTSNLIVANGDATNTADQLQIAINEAVTGVNSGSLHLQALSKQHLLSQLNRGRGVDDGSFLITDSAGASAAVNLRVLDAKTVGDVLDAINALNIGVEARLNTTGDGLLLVDTAGGTGQLSVADVGNGTAAADLRIAGQSTEVDLHGTPTKLIDGSLSDLVQIEAGDTLQDVIDKINALDAGMTASAFNVGSGPTPIRLSLVSHTTGRAGEILIDASQAGFQFQEISKAQDALLLVGSANAVGAGLLVSSPDGQFDQVLDGVSLTLTGSSTEPVSLTVQETDESLLLNVQTFVDQFNKLTERLESLTFFNEQDSTTGLLFGTSEVLRVEMDLAQLLTGRITGAGPLQSLESVGISMTDDGKLKFDKNRFKGQLAADPEAVREFFTNEQSGVSVRLHATIELLVGEENSVLINRTVSNQRQLDIYSERIEKYNERLERQRELLLKQFYDMETALGRLQNQMSALTALQNIRPPQQ